MYLILTFAIVFTSCAYGGVTQQWRGVLINGAAGTQVYSRQMWVARFYEKNSIFCRFLFRPIFSPISCDLSTCPVLETATATGNIQLGLQGPSSAANGAAVVSGRLAYFGGKGS